MAAVTGTSSSYSVAAAGGNREDLEDTIHELFADENYFTGSFDKVKASGTLHEWLGDELAAPGANIAIEGNDSTFATIANPARYSNYLQILEKTFVVSETQDVVAKAGRRSEVGRQAVKKMREAANDLEYAIARNQAGTAGSASVGRSMASIESWIGATAASSTVATQVVLSTTTAGATTAPVASGTPAAAPTDGTTTAALTEVDLKLALESNYNNGSMTDVIVVAGTAKNYINAFTGIATRNVDVGRTSQGSITGAADLYVSNYGVHRIVLHRHVRSTVALCLDPSLWAIATLRGWSSTPLAKTGDAAKRLINCEKTLVCRNPKGNAKVVAIA
jgi:hypothetical protein